MRNRFFTFLFMIIFLFSMSSTAFASAREQWNDLRAVIGAEKGTRPSPELTHPGSGIIFKVFESLPGEANIITPKYGDPDSNFNYKQYYIDLGWPDDLKDEEYRQIAEDNPECKPEATLA